MSQRIFLPLVLSSLATAACVATEGGSDDVQPPVGGKADGSTAFYGVGSSCAGGDCGFELQLLNAGVTTQVRGIDWPALHDTAVEEINSNLFGARVVIMGGAYDREELDEALPWMQADNVWVAVNHGFVPGAPSYIYLTRKREFCPQEPCAIRFDQYTLNGPQLDPVTEVDMSGISVEPMIMAELERQLTTDDGLLVLGAARELPDGARFVVSRAYLPR